MSRRAATLALACILSIAGGVRAEEVELELQHGQAACAERGLCIVRKDDLEALVAEHKAGEAQRVELERLRAQLKELLEAKRGKLQVIPKSELRAS